MTTSSRKSSLSFGTMRPSTVRCSVTARASTSATSRCSAALLTSTILLDLLLPLLLLACDMSYDADAIANLCVDARTAQLLSSCRPLLLFSRSDNFAHMDVTTRRPRRRNGFACSNARAARTRSARRDLGDAPDAVC